MLFLRIAFNYLFDMPAVDGLLTVDYLFDSFGLIIVAQILSGMLLRLLDDGLG